MAIKSKKNKKIVCKFCKKKDKKLQEAKQCIKDLLDVIFDIK